MYVKVYTIHIYAYIFISEPRTNVYANNKYTYKYNFDTLKVFCLADECTIHVCCHYFAPLFTEDRFVV